MAKCEWVLIAQSTAVDQRTSALSIFNIVEQIEVPEEALKTASPEGLSPVGPAFQCVCFLRRNNGEERGIGKLSIQAPNGVEVAFGEISFDLSGKFETSRTIVDIPALPVNGPGVYTFVLALKNGDAFHSVGSATLVVKIRASAS